MEDEGIESSCAEKDLGVLMVKKLSMSQLHPGLHQKSASSQSREVTLPLYSHETPAGVLCSGLGTSA